MFVRQFHQFVSNIFPRSKKDGGYRIILDLMSLNPFVQYKHFKMEIFVTAKQLVSRRCYVACIDLKDAYYSVPVHRDNRKYLKFSWMSQLWQFKALPNGLTSAPRLFTKLLKPVLGLLWAQDHVVMAYLDYILIIGKTRETAESSISVVKLNFERLGFLIHPDISKLTPIRVIDYLGFSINSNHMSVTLPKDKRLELIEGCMKLIEEQHPSIKQVASLIGKLVVAFPAVQFGPLHYQNLQCAKEQAVRLHTGHYDRPMQLPAEAIVDVHWWIMNISSSSSKILGDQPSIV